MWVCLTGQDSRSHGRQYVPLHKRIIPHFSIEILHTVYLYINTYIFIEHLSRTAKLASPVHSFSRGPASQTQSWLCWRFRYTIQVLIRASVCNLKALAVGIHRWRKSPVGQRLSLTGHASEFCPEDSSVFFFFWNQSHYSWKPGSFQADLYDPDCRVQTSHWWGLCHIHETILSLQGSFWDGTGANMRPLNRFFKVAVISGKSPGPQWRQGKQWGTAIQ